MDNPKVIGEVMAALVVGTLVLCLLGGVARRWWAAGSWALLLALAAAPLAVDRPFLGEGPQWRSTDANHADPVQRVMLAGVPLAVAAFALAARRLPAWPRGVVAAAAPAAVVYWMFAAFQTPPADWKGQVAFAVVASAVLWLLIEPLAVRRPTGIAAPWVCGCLAAGAAALNLLGSNTNPGAVALAVGGVAGGAFLFALSGRGPSFAGGPVGVVAPVLACVAVAGHVGGGEVTTGQWLTLAAAAAVAWAVELKPVRNWRPWLREPLRMALVAIPVVLVVVPAYRQWAKEQAAETNGTGWSSTLPVARPGPDAAL